MNETNFYILLIIATIIFGIATGGTIFQGAVGPIQKSPLPDYNTQSIFDRPANSTYKGDITIGSVAQPGTAHESINLYLNSTSGSDIVVTGWKVRSTISGKEVAINTTTTLPYQIQETVDLPSATPTGTLIRMNGCAPYLEQNSTTYNTCVARFLNTTNFLTPEWRLYSGPGKKNWNAKRDNLQLLDAQGRLVSEYSYSL